MADPFRGRIAVVGAGALGCALLPRLARMRITVLTIIDGDTVEAANLDNQELYAEVDVGHAKASTARGWVQHIGPGMEVRAVDRFLDVGNARELLQDRDLVADCTDDLHAKELIDRTCGELGLPLVSGGVHEDRGQVIVLHAPGEHNGLYRADLFRGRPGAEQDGCDMRRVPLATIEATAAHMAALMRALTRGEPVPNGTIALFDPAEGTWSTYTAPVT